MLILSFCFLYNSRACFLSLLSDSSRTVPLFMIWAICFPSSSLFRWSWFSFKSSSSNDWVSVDVGWVSIQLDMSISSCWAISSNFWYFSSLSRQLSFLRLSYSRASSSDIVRISWWLLACRFMLSERIHLPHTLHWIFLCLSISMSIQKERIRSRAVFIYFESQQGVSSMEDSGKIV